MDKIEFSDIYKFIASIGLILIGMAVVLPWFINHDTPFLLIEANKIKALTPTAQNIIKDQQSTLSFLNNWIVVASLILFSGGITMLIWSIINWRKRQMVVDGIQDEELKSRQLQNISIQDKRELIKEDINTELNTNYYQNEHGPVQQTDIDEQIDEYIKIENIVYSSLKISHSLRYDALQNVSILNIAIDVILRSKTRVLRDRLIEIKYLKSNLTFEPIQSLMEALFENTKIYRKTVKRSASPVLLVFYSTNEYPDLLVQFKKRLQAKAKAIGEINFKVNFYPKSMMDDGIIKNYLVDHPKLPEPISPNKSPYL